MRPFSILVIATSVLSVLGAAGLPPPPSLDSVQTDGWPGRPLSFKSSQSS